VGDGGVVVGVGTAGMGIDNILTGHSNIQSGQHNKSVFEFGVYRVTGNETASFVVPMLTSFATTTWGLWKIGRARWAVEANGANDFAMSGKATVSLSSDGNSLSNLDSLIEGLGNLRGQPLSQTRLKMLRDELWAKKVILDPVGPTDAYAVLKLGPKERAKFRINVNKATGVPQEFATIYIRPGVTGYDIQHELYHLRHARKIGYENYIKLTPLVREQYVFDHMINPVTWNQLTEREGLHAVDYLHYIHSGNTRGFMPSPMNPFN